MSERTTTYRLGNVVIELFAGSMYRQPYTSTWWVTVTLVTPSDKPNISGQQNFTDIGEARQMFDELVTTAAAATIMGQNENGTFNLVNDVLVNRYMKIYSRVTGDILGA